MTLAPVQGRGRGTLFIQSGRLTTRWLHTQSIPNDGQANLSRATRLRSDKYEKNVTKRGNVPVGKAAVRTGAENGDCGTHDSHPLQSID